MEVTDTLAPYGNIQEEVTMSRTLGNRVYAMFVLDCTLLLLLIHLQRHVLLFN